MSRLLGVAGSWLGVIHGASLIFVIEVGRNNALDQKSITITAYARSISCCALLVAIATERQREALTGQTTMTFIV